MSELSKEELLEQLNNAFYNSSLWLKQEGILKKFIEKKEQAINQIVALIQKPEVTEEFIEEKANEMEQMSMQNNRKKDREYFIRSLVEEIK